ncbi:MAG TPA: DMT family transporter [Mycobacteriales bacterium]|jgi:drug/metabolite transporter (DMT)-like permease|nr:DMT family transporter [Mycobacteriales bacterium]
MIAVGLPLALLAAALNAASNVLQRAANRHAQDVDAMSLRLIDRLARQRIWRLGILTVIGSFIAQALALANGQLSVVQPVIILELPMTLLAASRIWHGRLRRQDWVAIGAMCLGLAGLLGCLHPHGGRAGNVPAFAWILGLTLSAALVIGLSVAAVREPARSDRRAALFGVASGVTFGLTAALIKAATEALSESGPAGLFTAWQTYLTAVAGLAGLWLVQAAFNAGRLVSAQPGITLADPAVAILWGTLVFNEQTNGFPLLAVGAACVVLLLAGAFALARSPDLASSTSQGDADQADDRGGADEQPRDVVADVAGVQPVQATHQPGARL